jgi:hypothetical protein
MTSKKEFQEEYETSCPIKYPEEVANRPIGYNASCACKNENCSKGGETLVYQIIFEYRPRCKDVSRGEMREFNKCIIDLCEFHHNLIKKENGGVLPIFVGSDTWDAMDRISKYCE